MCQNLFCDIAYRQQNCKSERICGDTFLFRHTNGGTRSIAVLSDGMGHGVKANILSTLTASMIINFDYQNDDISKIAKMVIDTLPVCSVRQLSYSTFSIVDINHTTGIATIIEYDNPQRLVYREGKELILDSDTQIVVNEETKRAQAIIKTQFKFKDSDRIVFMSDGVTQSGLGTNDFPFGWNRSNVDSYIQQILGEKTDISSEELAQRVLDKAVDYDKGYTNDDISCGVITIRKVKRLLLSSCLPITDDYNSELISMLDNHEGQKVICGYHLAKNVSEIKGIDIKKDAVSLDPDIQPAWHMKGVDMITESLVTLNKVYDMLQNYEFYKNVKGPAAEICKMLLGNDSILMVIGLRRGNGGMYMVDEFELRRKVMRYIARILEKRYKKEVLLHFI
ncbi:MAG: SpoIIE family protein phosphatase [Rikenellaceae bacterium]